MPFDLETAKRHIRDFNFRELFIEDLGWDTCTQHLSVGLEGVEFELVAVAQKRGLVAFTCTPPAGQPPPGHALRRKIDSKVARAVHEHVIVFTDRQRSSQVWQWVRREPGKPIACRPLAFHRGQSGEALAQRLQALAFSLEEEESVTIVDAARRVRAGFDADRVTKRFYERFRTEHDALQRFMKGIPDEASQRWYASVMLNRLMFIYFIQKKRFLNDDEHYLRTKLEECRSKGRDRYYREFLCPLFFEGFAKSEGERNAQSQKLLGSVPYLNGGLFLRHQIEQAHGERIQIADAAFDRLFAFFEDYRWHLDERPLRDDREINPDVLGYIFEKYVNQKEMGAYYTKEDITGYITQNTVIPRLLDMTREKCRIAFEGAHSAWRLIRDDPDRYIYPAVRRGVVDDDGAVLPEAALPDFVRSDMHDARARMFDRRYNVGRAEIPGPDGANLALPAETWREYGERRVRCLDLRQRLANGEVAEPDDLITLNLDIRQFARDIIETSEGPELVRASWKALSSISVLDPTAGSGAFLFAALNILDDLYEACLDRMQGFLDELEESGKKHRPEKYADFRAILDRMATHPSRRYFVLKTIMVNNLYGVDIMEEAVEICRLRLFLKLVAQIERPEQIEPLPDIDFNIRAGNTLVGFATRQSVVDALTIGEDGQRRMLFGEVEDALLSLEARADLTDRAFAKFREMQTKRGMPAAEFATAKTDLRRRLLELCRELDRLLARQYGVDPDRELALAEWRASHQPFHWFTEFHDVLARGGFDAVVGNPPFVEYEKVRGTYSIKGFETAESGNLFAFVWERALSLACVRGRTGLIVPVASICADGYSTLRSVLLREGSLVISAYNDRPSKLFEGLEHVRLSIILHLKGLRHGGCFSSGYYKWAAEERPALFEQLEYVETTDLASAGPIPKVRDQVERGVLHALRKQNRTVGDFVRSRGPKLFYTRKLSHFVQVLDFVPRMLDDSGGVRKPSELKALFFEQKETRDAVLAALNSSLFFFFLTAVSDCRNLNKRDVLSFPAFFLPVPDGSPLARHAQELMADLRGNSEERQMTYSGLGTLSIQCTFPRRSKRAIDNIDRVLTGVLGLSERELDRIVNFDVKYRMGLDRDEVGEA